MAKTPAFTFLLQQLHFNSYQQLEFQFSHPRQNPAPTAARSWEAGSNRGMPPIAASSTTSYSTGVAATLTHRPTSRTSPKCGPGSSAAGLELGSSTAGQALVATASLQPAQACSLTSERKQQPANLYDFLLFFFFFFFPRNNFCSRRNPQACLQTLSSSTSLEHFGVL